MTHASYGGHDEGAVKYSPKYLHEYVWEYKLREHFNNKQKVPILGILVDYLVAKQAPNEATVKRAIDYREKQCFICYRISDDESCCLARLC